AARFDMNNLQSVLPNAKQSPGYYGIGHAYGLQRFDDLELLFGLKWVLGTFQAGTRNTDRNYYGHWAYVHQLNPLPAQDPDFFQIIDYAMNQAIGRNDPNHVFNTFSVGAAIIDQYDSDDVYDSPDQSTPGNTITIIDPFNDSTHPLNYVYGIESLSWDDQSVNRPPFAPPPPMSQQNYPLLNRRFENVGEFGYAYNPASDPTRLSRTLDFASTTSNDRGLLDFFTYNAASSRAGIVNLNARPAPVLASILRGAWVHDPGYTFEPSPTPAPPTTLVSQDDAL